ncbi:MAG: aminotransferase class III-fold pyridoxal phosphate-dependent enzyme, partial [Halobacteria archaeon]|nr:aminotransferase class III-fold pyridoxal phosphate-dependent enzyme [Halobacteria archaeon]
GFFVDGTSSLRRKLHPEKGHINADELAYLILEPIQGEGGYNIPSQDFMDEIQEVKQEYNIHVIADEIQSGMGRTGKMWASDHYSLEPDVIGSAKGLRVGATVSRSEVFPEEKSRISSTWGAGDIISSLQGALTLDIIREYDLLENATRRGEQMKEILRDADPEGVKDIRGKGLMLAVEFETKEMMKEVKKAAFKRGLLTLTCGYSVIRLLPPLDVREREIEMGAELFLKAIDDVT